MLAGIDLKSILPAVVEPPDFCNRCRSLQLWSAGFSFSDTPAGLVEGSTRCSLCRLLSRCLRGREIGEHENVRFFRVGSYLTIQDTRRQPIVSIYTMPGSGTPSPYIQIGFPKLPAASSPIHMRVLAEWIRGCDRAHQCYPRQLSILPTRVLDVGDSSSRTLRLACRPRGEPMSGRYLALSHRWGSPQQHKKFCTYATNIGRLTRSIDMDELPRTFRDAVTITRGLGIQYLWIDSLCIIQDDPEDWDMESKLMEEVFSSAYCTIAASCASGTDDGFLKPRPERRCVAMRRGSGAPYYLCDAIDDFPLHVDQGELNKRGWVLQERALSRRTIYFTEKQSYWECGVGVRCETLTTMRNLKASFLGDSNFPHSAEAYVKGTKIQLYQSLYERYSNLALSVIADRPTAIRGLEKRLVRTFNTLGGYGIFDCYLHRGLLWQRAGDSVRPIVSLRGERVPSWSWMAYEGGITYVDVPFGEAAWNNDVTSPFRGTGRKTHSGDSQLHGGEAVMLEMEALAYELVWPDNPLLILDEPDRTSSGLPKCVIIGIGKSEKKMDKHQAHYVLVVSVLGRDRDVEICERIGVGCLEGDQIAFDRPATEVRIW